MAETYFPTGRSFVNTWDCDEMGHMNVQVYVERFYEATRHMALHLDAVFQTREDAVIYAAELRQGEPYHLESCVIAQDGRALTLFHHMIASADGRTAATCVSQVTADRDIDTVLSDAAGPVPREDIGAALPAPGLDAAMALGMVETYRGVVRAQEVDADGVMTPRYAMARFSDGAGHIWGHIGLPRPMLLERNIGGAVLQSRLQHGTPAGLGDPVIVMSGFVGMGGKTFSFAHWLLNARTGEAITSSRAVAVLFDLEKRKAMDVGDDIRTIVTPHLIKP